MSISRVYRREHLAPLQKVWVTFAEHDEHDASVIALINEIEESAEFSTHRKADIQRGFIIEGLKRLYGCDSLVELCRQRGLRRSDGREFGNMANAAESQKSASRTEVSRPSRPSDKSSGGRPPVGTVTGLESHTPGRTVETSDTQKRVAVPEILQLTPQPTAKPIIHRGPMAEFSQLREPEAPKPESPLPVQADAGLPKPPTKTKTGNLMWS